MTAVSPLSPTQDATLREMAARKASVSEISTAIRAPRGVVRRYMAKHSIAGRQPEYSPIPEDVRTQAAAMLKAGSTCADVIRQFKLAPATVQRIKVAAGIEKRRELYLPSEDATIFRLTKEKAKPHEIVAALPGRTYASVHARSVILGVALGGRKPRTEGMVECVREMAAQGASNRVIGAAAGLSRTGVRKVMRNHAIVAQKAPPKPRKSRPSRARKPQVILKPVRRIAGPPEMSKILAVFEPATDAMVEARNRAVTRRGCDNPRWSWNVRPTHEYCGAAVRVGETYCAGCRMGLVTVRQWSVGR